MVAQGYIELTAGDGSTKFLVPSAPRPVLIAWGSGTRVLTQGATLDVDGAPGDIANLFPPTENAVFVTAPITGDGTSADPIGIDAATALERGTMSAADFAKLELIVAGTYAPTITVFAGTNLSATGPTFTYQRNGSVVSVAGLLQITSTGAGTTVFKVSLPVATTSLVGTGGVIISPAVTTLPTVTLANAITGPPSTALVSITATGANGATNANFFFQYLVT